ncbi:hypothetical protein BDV97DRAFT_401031 [Delphinella strobiligena]|nr:hypothetical protein BDV97DRAFT_401031 [Delphinella strobiligena]
MKEHEGKHIWSVDHGPLTIKSNEIERMGGVKSDGKISGISLLETRQLKQKVRFDERTIRASTKLSLDALADQSLHYLTTNPMSSDTAEEAASDYTSIHVLKTAVTNKSAASSNTQKHNLFNDDLRLGNILIDDDFNIVALIDWEYSYVAPTIFTHATPWWIIGREPFEWEDQDMADYSERLGMLVGFIRDAESSGGHEDTLSSNMQRCWEDGTFWLAVALREFRFLKETMARAGNAEAFAAAAALPVDLKNCSEDFGKRKMEQRRRYEEKVSCWSRNRRCISRCEDVVFFYALT